MVITAKQEVTAARDAAQRVVETHHHLVDYLRAGLTLAEIDGFVARTLDDLQCKSAFLRYKIKGHPPFPSHACLSVNDCIVHGTHNLSQTPLQPGDVISIDIGVKYRGWVGDAAWTYAIEDGDEQILKMMATGRESLRRGIAAMQPGRPLVDWARAVQRYVEGECGFHLIRGLGGHGYGRTLHGAPFISNVEPARFGEWPEAGLLFEPGMLLAVEPMIAVTTPQTHSKRRQWPIFTADGSRSVHYEADVLITPDGPEDLTQGMQNLPDIVSG